MWVRWKKQKTNLHACSLFCLFVCLVEVLKSYFGCYTSWHYLQKYKQVLMVSFFILLLCVFSCRYQKFSKKSNDDDDDDDEKDLVTSFLRKFASDTPNAMPQCFFCAEMSCRKEMCLFEYLKLHSFSISLPCFTCSLSRISHCKVLCTLSTVFHRYTRLTLAAHIQRREFRTS